MDVQKMIRNMTEAAFDEDFFREIYAAYDSDAQDDFREVEADLRTALEAFEGIQPEYRQLLDEMRAHFADCRQYAARFGFTRGLYAGFRQSGSGHSDSSTDFHYLVEDGLFTVPGMERHPQFLAGRDHCNVIYDKLIEALGSDAEEHVVSVYCAWDERVHHAACMAYYCGYRAALALLEEISPSLYFSMVPQRLMTEYMFGFCKLMA